MKPEKNIQEMFNSINQGKYKNDGKISLLSK